ncbi:GNAT family N-acetyltransferase [Heyndrickxia camelliae]|uniref:GNAT family N-acetyltransferase n=1 Tax=Heyndrickxia camelliae TaxID=1707093 RepID=A0A2N3LK73_9BACI|nr:GNAT family protein [Heyndrickxia camelliae]PKR84943.1 GNAT family N-acetyltransferase [Heyndrickxia camelliae]
MISSILLGEKVKLNALIEEDLTTIMEWFQNTSLLRLFDAIPAQPRSTASLRSWFEEHANSNNQYVLAIRTIDDNQLIGYIELDGILWNQRTTWVSIAIGEEMNRGKGYGKEALELILQYAFHELNLRRVQLTVFSYNLSAIQLYKKSGFTYEGTYREFLERDGKTYDMLLFGLLKKEWEQNRSNSK